MKNFLLEIKEQIQFSAIFFLLAGWDPRVEQQGCLYKVTNSWWKTLGNTILINKNWCCLQPFHHQYFVVPIHVFKQNTRRAGGGGGFWSCWYLRRAAFLTGKHPRWQSLSSPLLFTFSINSKTKITHFNRARKNKKHPKFLTLKNLKFEKCNVFLSKI